MRKIIFFILLILSFAELHAVEKREYLLISQFATKTGFYFDAIEDINSELAKTDFPLIEHNSVGYIGLNYCANHVPFLFNSLPNYTFALEVKLPFTRETRSDTKSTRLNTSSFYIEFEGFHDLLNQITLYPVLGLGLSWTRLDLTDDLNNGSITEVISNNSTTRSITKKDFLLLLAGGLDYRCPLLNDAMKRLSLAFGLNAGYALSMDFLGIVDSDWKNGGASLKEMPNYHAPGLFIELKFGIEIMQNPHNY